MDILSKEATARLIAWYEANKRDLPWRHDPTPYQTWVSEIMLQQTRVEAVKKYYLAWMRSFPTVEALAQADEGLVLKRWEGLGYYSRARNILKAAKMIVSIYGGRVPDDEKELLRLPGIGAYTAGAILSISYCKPVPAVDGNVLRVSSRLAADPFDIRDVGVRKKVADALRPQMEGTDPSAFTQALFELGALVCVPDTPRCDGCPVSAYCKAYRAGKQAEFPVRPEKKEKRVEEKTVSVLRYGDLYVLQRRPEKGLLAGLYEFPNEAGFRSKEEIEKKYGGEATPLPTAKHVFTHVVWYMTGFLVDLTVPIIPEGAFFATKEEIDGKYSLPTAFSAYKRFCT